MPSPSLRGLSPGLAAVALAACDAVPVLRPSPAELGNRFRVTIEGRGKEPSITTADYLVLFVVRDQNGRRVSLGVHANEYADSASIAAEMAVKMSDALGLPQMARVEVQQGNPACEHEVVLPQGVTLCFEAGCHYAFRVDPATRRRDADPQPEIRLSMPTADGTRYVELPPGAAPSFGPDDPCPTWPPPGVER